MKSVVRDNSCRLNAEKPLGICSSTIRHLSLQDGLASMPLDIISVFDVCAGDHCIIDLKDKAQSRCRLNLILAYDLKIDTINSYHSIFDENSIRELVKMASMYGIKKIRLALPSVNTSLSDAFHSTRVDRRFFPGATPPFLNVNEKMQQTRLRLEQLSLIAEANGIIFLFENHWATMMSSFSSAHGLLSGTRSDCLKLIWDPANMFIEGKEDFDMGLSLIEQRVDTVHVKNVSWKKIDNKHLWDWEKIEHGMVNWKQIVLLLKAHGLFESVSFKIEDFTLLSKSGEQFRKEMSDIRTLLFEQCEEMHVAKRAKP